MAQGAEEEPPGKPSPAISVIVPVGGLDPSLETQIAALAAQDTDFAWELVVALNDPGLVDQPPVTALLASIHNAVVVDASKVRSAAFARNRGAAESSAELLAFCDGDDIVERGWLAALASALVSADLVGGRLDEDMLAIAGQESWRPPATPGGLPSFLGHQYVVSANMGVRRELFEQIGGFDETLIRGEDMAFSFAAIDRGASPVYAPDAVVAYRHRAGLGNLLRLHYLYGRGMSQIIARGSLPVGSVGGSFRANGQRVDRLSAVHVLRRGAIALGRLRGLVDERARGRGRASR